MGLLDCTSNITELTSFNQLIPFQFEERFKGEWLRRNLFIFEDIGQRFEVDYFVTKGTKYFYVEIIIDNFSYKLGNKAKFGTGVFNGLWVNTIIAHNKISLKISTVETLEMILSKEWFQTTLRQMIKDGKADFSQQEYF